MYKGIQQSFIDLIDLIGPCTVVIHLDSSLVPSLFSLFYRIIDCSFLFILLLLLVSRTAIHRAMKMFRIDYQLQKRKWRQILMNLKIKNQVIIIKIHFLLKSKKLSTRSILVHVTSAFIFI